MKLSSRLLNRSTHVGAALLHYRYAASELIEAPAGSRLRLATSGGVAEHPFFQGRLTRPQRTADLLRGLVQIVQSRFHVPGDADAHFMEADPSSPAAKTGFASAFSACCSLCPG